MDRLIQLVAALWDWFSWFLRSAVDGAISFAQTVWAKWLIVCGWILLVYNWGLDMLYRLTDIIGSWMFDQFNLAIPDIVKQALALSNYCFPLVEIIVMTIAYCNILIIMVVYRHIKSMIPSPIPGGGGT